MADKETTKIIRRLKSVEERLRRVTMMTEAGASCLDICNQINVTQAALQQVNLLMLNRYLHTCITAIASTDNPAERSQWIDRMMRIFQARHKIH
jgi:DNA-binding FrmR family transcriptional regulator